jgi:hypothetical protein
MPWPWEMCQWLYDPIMSRETGRAEFRLPYPSDSWLEAKNKNEELLLAMRYVWKANAVFGRDAAKWTADEKQFFLAYETEKMKLGLE